MSVYTPTINPLPQGYRFATAEEDEAIHNDLSIEHVLVKVGEGDNGIEFWKAAVKILSDRSCLVGIVDDKS